MNREIDSGASAVVCEELPKLQEALCKCSSENIDIGDTFGLQYCLETDRKIEAQRIRGKVFITCGIFQRVNIKKGHCEQLGGMTCEGHLTRKVVNSLDETTNGM